MLLEGKKVLIGFAEAAAAPEVVFSLHGEGARVTAFGREGTRPSIARIPGVEIASVTSPETDVERTADGLSAIVARGGFDAVLALDDASLWLIERLRSAGAIPGSTAIAGPRAGQASLALDKRLQVAAAKASGFAVPETFVVEGALDPNAGSLPAMLKPALAAELAGRRLTRAKAAYIESPADLPRARAAASTMSAGLVQPFIHGTGEGVFGLCRDGEILTASGHRRVRMTNPHGSGSCACAFKQPSAESLASATRFLAAASWDGLFMIELLTGDDGTSWFMELNGRPWGSMALARRAGFDYPAWAVRAALDPGYVPKEPAPRDGLTVRHLGNDIVHLMFVLRGPRTRSHRARWPRFLPTLAKVLTPAPGAAFYNWDPDHPGFFAREALDTVGRFVRKRVG